MAGCWLCAYNHTADAKLINTFIADNAGIMSPCQVAAQVSKDLVARFPDETGVDQESCMRHIESHTLNPICRISSMLRALLKLSDELQQNIRKFDEDGNSTLDPKLIETYLKVQTQILGIYRQPDAARLMFSEKGA